MKVAIAALLLIASVAHELGHQLVGPTIDGEVWSATGGALDVVLFAIIWGAYESRVVRVVCLLAGVFAAQTFVCNAGWIWLRWERFPGSASCTDNLTPILSALTLVAIGMVTEYVASKNSRSAE